jgi:hypothetical protein
LRPLAAGDFTPRSRWPLRCVLRFSRSVLGRRPSALSALVGDSDNLFRTEARVWLTAPLSSPPTRNNMRAFANQFPLARLSLRHWVDDVFAFLKIAFGAVRPTHRVAHALPIQLLCCCLASSPSHSLLTLLISPGIAF